MRILKCTVLIFTLILAYGCSKSGVNKANTTIPGYHGALNGGVIADGTYAGQLYADETSFNEGLISTNVTVTFSNNNYNSTTDFRFGANAQGKFQLNNNQISLQDSTVHTANFDWGLILTGTYSYNTKADSLIIVKGAGSNTYIYKLKKQ